MFFLLLQIRVIEIGPGHVLVRLKFPLRKGSMKGAFSFSPKQFIKKFTRVLRVWRKKPLTLWSWRRKDVTAAESRWDLIWVALLLEEDVVFLECGGEEKRVLVVNIVVPVAGDSLAEAATLSTSSHAGGGGCCLWSCGRSRGGTSCCSPQDCHSAWLSLNGAGYWVQFLVQGAWPGAV